jgi:hypothetical protein
VRPAGSQATDREIEILVLDRSAFLQLNIHPVVPQMKYYDSVHLPLPDELRPILCEANAGEQKNT